MDNSNQAVESLVENPSEAWDYPTIPVKRSHLVKASDFNPRVPYTVEGPGANSRAANRVFWGILIGILVMLALGLLAAALRR